MAYLILLLGLTLVPFVAITVLRVNGAVAFMSLALGSVLVTYASDDVLAILGSLSVGNSHDKTQWIKLALLLLPFLLTIIFARKTVKGSKQALNLLPALSAGLLCALLAVPLLPAAMQKQVHAQAMWHQLDNLQTAVILGGTVLSLLFLLIAHRRKHDAGDEKAKH
jgi:hypothetical protein